MKPSELLKDFKVSGHSTDEQTLNRYLYQDVVTSYIKNSFGIVFLIKGKVKPFAFAVIKNNLSNHYYNYNIRGISIKDFFQLREIAEQETQEIVFNDEEKEKQIKAIMLLNELKENGNTK